MSNKGDLAPPRPAKKWTQADDYLGAMAQRRTARRARENKSRSEPEAPRFTLSTLPFLALMGGLAVLALAIAIAAWPGGRATPQAALQPPAAEQGTAARGWFQEAQKDFKRS